MAVFVDIYTSGNKNSGGYTQYVMCLEPQST